VKLGWGDSNKRGEGIIEGDEGGTAMCFVGRPGPLKEKRSEGGDDLGVAFSARVVGSRREIERRSGKEEKVSLNGHWGEGVPR